MPGPTLRDSRRLPGPNLITERPGAVIDIATGESDLQEVVSAWQLHARMILDAVGWRDEVAVAREYHDGASLVVTAPIDVLYAATEVNEWAWEATTAQHAARAGLELDAAATRLRRAIADERNPALLAIRDAAAAHDVAFLWDDDIVTVGMGAGSHSWEAHAVPDPRSVDWSAVHDVPVALVTGSNGKTTTVRLIAAMARASGQVVGMSCTDGLYVDGELLDAGDWSGPGGGRAILRDPRVQIGVLETARGGILRRGLGVDRANAAIVTNVAADHLGEWGIEDVGAIADAKLVVRRALGPDGMLVINADDPTLVNHTLALDTPVTWMSLRADHELLVRAHAGGQTVYTVIDDAFVRRTKAGDIRILPVAEAPITIRGAAQHNVYNALSAIALGSALGLSDDTMAVGLQSFGGSARENPGRGNFFSFNGVQVLVDFAHNPHGMDALAGMVAKIPAGRRLVLIGQAGDRDDESIRGLARALWQVHPDRVVIKEMRKYLRGREEGVIPKMIEDELLSCGASPDRIEHADTEWQGVRRALTWAKPGDFLFLPLHADRDHVLDLMQRLSDSDWAPGEPLPALD